MISAHVLSSETLSLYLESSLWESSLYLSYKKPILWLWVLVLDTDVWQTQQTASAHFFFADFHYICWRNSIFYFPAYLVTKEDHVSWIWPSDISRNIRGWGVFESICFLHKGIQSASTVLALNFCQQQRPTLSPRYGTIPCEDQPAMWQKVDYIGPFPSWMGQRFILTSTDTYYLRFSFPACDVSASITNHGLTECFIHHLGIPHSLLSEQKTHFTAKEVRQCMHAHGINFLTPCFATWNQLAPLKGGMTHWKFSYSAGWRYHPERLEFCLTGCRIYLNQRPLWPPPHPNTCSRNEGVKWEWLLSL